MVLLLLAAVLIVVGTQATADRHSEAQGRADRAIANTGLFQEAISSAYDEWVMVTSYFVTQDEAYITRFRESRSRVDESLAELIADARVHDAAFSQQLDEYAATHGHFAAAEEQVIDEITSGDLLAAISIAVDSALTVESAAFLEDLKGEIEAQQAELRSAQREQERAVEATARWSLAIGGLCLVLLAVVGAASYQWIGKALRRTSLATRAIASGDLTARVRREGPRELADLADDVNSMADALIRRSEELNAYLAQDLEARTRELERANGDLEREVEDHRRTSQSLQRTLETERELKQQLRHQAFHDGLTQLANRARFLDRLEHAAERAVRDGKQLAVLFIDIDDFKSVNDSLGHPAGDRLLQEVARRIVACLRPGDTAARIGGDEFAVLVEEVAHADEARHVAERILLALQSPVALEMHEVFVRASIGVALGTSADPPDEVLRRADVAMYAVKSRGKNGHALYRPAMESSVGINLALASQLQRALERDELALHYQPSVRLSDGNIAGVEALLRWNHPTRGMLAPQEFISVAESTGIIIPIGQWVIEQACKQGRQWQLQFPAEPPLSIAVNVSAAQVHQPGLLDIVRGALNESGLPPSSLILEITETVMMQNVERSMAHLMELKVLGVRLAIDDFGTGYSSLSYLRRFPIDVLKIDKSFVDGLTEQGKEQEIVQSIIELGQSLDLEIVAEGVEQVEQVGWLRARSCDFVQGFYFSEPLPPEDVGALLRAAPQSKSA
ncbi:MAG: EAL domain-containing protein [Dehalococcoidia bacterium]